MVRNFVSNMSTCPDDFRTFFGQNHCYFEQNIHFLVYTWMIEGRNTVTNTYTYLGDLQTLIWTNTLLSCTKYLFSDLHMDDLIVHFSTLHIVSYTVVS